ncbi:MAG: hypothetical protein K2M44_01940 [Clostridia bacterium]|nr:hypothetical protein [Clostridia bacterium]
MKKKLSLILIAVALILSVVGIAACSGSEQAFYDGLIKDARKAEEGLSKMYTAMAERSYYSDFDVIYTYHDNVSRGTPDKEGWVNSDITDWYVQIAQVRIIVSLGEDGAVSYYSKVTIFNEMTDGHYDDVKGKRDFVKALEGEIWMDSQGVYSVYYDAEGNKTARVDLPNVYVGEYDIDALLTLWPAMTQRYSDLEDDLGDITQATYGFKLYCNLCQLGLRYVYDLDGNMVDSWHSDEVSSGYGDDLSYDWNKVSGLDNVRLSVTSDTAHVIDKFELFTERVLAYYQAKNEVDKTLVLKADVWAKTQITVDIKTKDVPAIPDKA